MMRVARRFSLPLLLVVIYFCVAVPPAAADPGRGRFAGCFQSCNLFHQLCVSNFIEECRDFPSPHGMTDYGTCISTYLPVCNRLAFDCKYNYCLGGDPAPLSVLPRKEGEPSLPRPVE